LLQAALMHHESLDGTGYRAPKQRHVPLAPLQVDPVERLLQVGRLLRAWPDPAPLPPAPVAARAGDPGARARSVRVGAAHAGLGGRFPDWMAAWLAGAEQALA
jgi:hypothetical protein